MAIGKIFSHTGVYGSRGYSFRRDIDPVLPVIALDLVHELREGSCLSYVFSSDCTAHEYGSPTPIHGGTRKTSIKVMSWVS